MQVSRYWRMNAQRYMMAHGGVAVAEKEEAREQEFSFSGRGEVFSYTTIYDAPAGFERTSPYVVALVKLAEGPMVTAQLTDVDPGEIEIGMPVEMVTRKLRTEGDEGVIVYGYKFRPELSV